MNFFQQMSRRLANFLGESRELDLLVENERKSSDFIDPDYFSDLLFYRLYDEEHKIYENKGSLGFVIEVIPLLGGGDEAEKEMSSLIREIGDEGSSIQCFAWADPRIDRFLECWAAPRSQQSSIFSQIAQKKVEFFRHESLQGEVPPRIFRFIFSYSRPKQSGLPIHLLLNQLVEMKKKALETFGRLSQTFDLSPVQLIELLSGVVNMGSKTTIDSRRSWNRQTWLSKQIALPGSAVEVHPHGLLFSNKENQTLFKSYEVTDYPDQWSLGLTGELLGDFFNKFYRLPSPFYLHYGIYFPSQQKLEMRQKGKAKIVDHQIKFPAIVRMLPHLPQEREEHLFVHKQLLEGEKFVETRFNCGVWASPSSHLHAESIVVALFQKFGFKLKENHFIHFPDFLSSLPMAWGEESSTIKNLRRARSFRTTMTSETARLIPVLGEWWGNSTKGVVLTGRRGQICSWDPFGAAGNLNTVVVGPSGSGKSVFMQDLIMSHLGQGGRVYVLDLGRSFQNLCHLLDGQYLEFSVKSRLDLNPFSCVNPDGDPEVLNTALDMVASIVATMAMPSLKIDKERADIVSALVKRAWELKGRQASIDDIMLLLDELKFESELMRGAAESLKEGLKKFGRTGVYANYFYGSQRVDFSHDLVVIETEELKNMADLQAVILQIFTMTLSSIVFMGGRERRCLICIDEAWDLLKSPQMEGFIESLARRLRKYNGALVIGTQSLKDFERSHGARAAFNNSNWLVTLGKDNDSINTLKKEALIPMDDFKELTLGSLRIEEGRYSELFIYHKGTGFFSVNQLKLDPFSAMLYSTKADEFQAVQELRGYGFSVEKAIDWLMINKALFKQRINQGQSVRDAIASLMVNTTKGDFYV